MGTAHNDKPPPDTHYHPDKPEQKPQSWIGAHRSVFKGSFVLCTWAVLILPHGQHTGDEPFNPALS